MGFLLNWIYLFFLIITTFFFVVRMTHDGTDGTIQSALSGPFDATWQPLNPAACLQRTTNGTGARAEGSKRQRHGRDQTEPFVIPKASWEKQAQREILSFATI